MTSMFLKTLDFQSSFESNSDKKNGDEQENLVKAGHSGTHCNILHTPDTIGSGTVVPVWGEYVWFSMFNWSLVVIFQATVILIYFWSKLT